MFGGRRDRIFQLFQSWINMEPPTLPGQRPVGVESYLDIGCMPPPMRTTALAMDRLA